MCHAVTASPSVECRPDVYAHEQKGTSATKLPKITITLRCELDTSHHPSASLPDYDGKHLRH